MLVLAIDTSSAAVTAAVIDVCTDPGTVRAERVIVDPRGHAEFLAPAIAACLAEAEAVPGQLAAIVAGTGPGPFTGLRVGLVTAEVMAALLGIPAYGVCSLDAIAGASADDASLLVAADARRSEIYWARYVDGDRVEGPAVSRPEQVHVQAQGMAGAGARRYADILGLPLVGPDYPDALALVQCASDRVRRAGPSEPLTPRYLRRPDALEPGRPKPVTR